MSKKESTFSAIVILRETQVKVQGDLEYGVVLYVVVIVLLEEPPQRKSKRIKGLGNMVRKLLANAVKWFLAVSAWVEFLGYLL